MEINSNVCIDCICVPVCLNKHPTLLINECKLIRSNILDISSNFAGKGESCTVHFFGINIDIPLQIFPDAIYTLDDGGRLALMTINRKDVMTRRF